MRTLFLLLGAIFAFVAAIAIVMVAGVPNRAAYTGILVDGERPVAPEINAYAPPFNGELLTGQSLEFPPDHPVILNFWATWCIPCAIEMPELQAFHEAHPQAQIIAVNLGEPREIVDAWINTGGYTFDIVLDPQGEIAALYALRGQPSTYIIAPRIPSGVITHIFFGATNQAALENALAPFL